MRSKSRLDTDRQQAPTSRLGPRLEQAAAPEDWLADLTHTASMPQLSRIQGPRPNAAWALRT